jgi:hypothetical protein
MAQKVLFCFIKISGEILLPILRPVLYFGKFLPNAVAVKRIKNYMCQSCTSLV